LDWGLCLGRIRNRSCYGSSLRRKRLCFANFFKGQTGNKKYFSNVDISKAYGSKDNVIIISDFLTD
jgi:hypothetical protein